jgi:molecular chaperone GrpE
VRKRKARRQVDDDQVDNDANRAPEPENLTGARAEARPEATETEAAAEAADTRAEADQDDANKPSEGKAEARETKDDAEAGPAAEEATETGTDEGDTDAEAGEKVAELGEEVTERADEEPDEVEVLVVAEDGEPSEDDAGEAAAEESKEEVVAELVVARAEAESYLDDLRRLQAEFDNYRKRTMREQTARIASASQALVAKLLPVLDNFELAVSHAEQSRDFDRMLKGVEMVFGELREMLSGEGLVSIEAEGKPFDPERHEAVVAVEQEGTEPGTVVDVIRKGYELNGRVLRPAMVKVAR